MDKIKKYKLIIAFLILIILAMFIFAVYGIFAMFGKIPYDECYYFSNNATSGFNGWVCHNTFK